MVALQPTCHWISGTSAGSRLGLELLKLPTLNFIWKVDSDVCNYGLLFGFQKINSCNLKYCMIKPSENIVLFSLHSWPYEAFRYLSSQRSETKYYSKFDFLIFNMNGFQISHISMPKFSFNSSSWICRWPRVDGVHSDALRFLRGIWGLCVCSSPSLFAFCLFVCLRMPVTPPPTHTHRHRSWGEMVVSIEMRHAGSWAWRSVCQQAWLSDLNTTQAGHTSHLSWPLASWRFHFLNPFFFFCNISSSAHIFLCPCFSHHLFSFLSLFLWLFVCLFFALLCTSCCHADWTASTETIVLIMLQRS